MNSQLNPAALLTLIAGLAEEVYALQAELENLRAENAELRKES